VLQNTVTIFLLSNNARNILKGEELQHSHEGFQPKWLASSYLVSNSKMTGEVLLLLLFERKWLWPT
jgi:hypothetical protein